MEAAAPGVDGDDGCWVEARSDRPLLPVEPVCAW